MEEKGETVPPPKAREPETKKAMLPLHERAHREHDAIKSTPDVGLKAVVRITRRIGAWRRATQA